MKTVVVAGANTDVGKTHVACALIHAARARGLSCDAFKPVLSGFEPADWEASDAGRLLAALGRTASHLDEISPWRFEAPLAPPLAARREGRRLEIGEILNRCRVWLAHSAADLRILEGAGGLMSPIAEDGLSLDLAQQLALPSILVGGGYLGAVSHTLTALEVMRTRGAPVLAVVVSQDASPDAPDLSETVELVRSFAGQVPVVTASRANEEWATELLGLVLHTRLAHPGESRDPS